MRPRPEGTVNDALPTGEIEVGATALEILNEAEPPPFPIDDRIDADEMLRLRHRYLDLRRPRLQRNLRVRAQVNAALHRSLDAQGFVEVETPMLIASTPEGARDFVVPSRLVAGLVLRAAAEPAAVQAAAAWSAASTATTRSPAACATRTCAPTASSSSCSSTPR